MTPIDKVQPAQPGNWTRRPDERKRRSGPERARSERRTDRDPPDGSHRDDRGDRDHIIDELA